jgi:hypothetical protein
MVEISYSSLAKYTIYYLYFSEILILLYFLLNINQLSGILIIILVLTLSTFLSYLILNYNFLIKLSNYIAIIGIFVSIIFLSSDISLLYLFILLLIFYSEFFSFISNLNGIFRNFNKLSPNLMSELRRNLVNKLKFEFFIFILSFSFSNVAIIFIKPLFLINPLFSAYLFLFIALLVIFIFYKYLL